MSPIAPLVAGWERRLGGQPGPFSAPAGSGESSAGNVQVELWIDGQWQDITSYVMTRDGSQNIAISHGQQNEGSQVQPARCAFQLNNRDGRFSPRNPTSPLYGKIGRNQPIRVSVPSGNDKAYRFWGEVPAWPQNWDTTGVDVWVEMEAAGVLRRLGQGSTPLGSAMRVALAGGSTTNTVIAYWPCEDASGATTIGSAVSGVPAMTISGTPTLATNTDFVCSGALPTMGTASFTARVPAYTPDGGLLSTNPFVTMLRFLLKIPQAGATNGQVVASFTWTGSIPTWEVYYSTSGSGQLGLRGKDSTGTVVQDTGVGGPAANGALLHVSAQLDESGGIALEFALSILVVGSTTASGPSSSALGPTAGIVTSVTVAPGRGLPDTVVGQVSLQLAPTTPLTDTATVAAVIAAHAGETAAARVQRLCGIAGIGFELVGTASDSVAMGTQLSGKILDLINQAVAADGGRLFERTSALGLGYRTRVSLENQAAALALSYPAGNLAQVPKPLDDDQYTRNDITVSRTGGSYARATLSTGALSVLAPPNGVGQYDDSVQLNVQSDSTLPDQAGWRLHLGTVDEARFPQISINLAHPSITGSTTIRTGALALRPGDRLTVSGMPAGQAPDTVSQLLLGRSETIDNFQHRITFNCQPESPYRVGVTDSADFGRVDTDGSALAADVTATGTTLSVATTTSGNPTWTTDLSETPFDLRIAGEQITVAAVGTLLNSNPFFLTDLTGWTAQNDSIARDTSVINSARDAVASMLITPNGSSASGGALSDHTGAGTVTPAANYVASLWAYSPAGWSDLRPAVDWYDSSNVFLSSSLGSGTSVAAGTWTYITQTFTAPASASQAVMRARHGSTPAATDIWYVWAPRLVDAASAVSTSPQPMTVIRSVNGVVKPQVTGADVRLNQPAIAAL